MSNIIKGLEGYRTYFIGTVGVLVALAWGLGYLPPDAAQSILGILGFGGMLTVRAAIANAVNQEA